MPQDGRGDRCIILLNERAGAIVASSADEVRGRIEAGYARVGVAVPELVFCPPAKVEERLRAELARGTPRIVVGGGDGTVATAAGVLLDSPTALGVLPLGTFNLVARDLRMPLDLEEAAAALATATPETIDVAEVNGRPFLCVCVLGFFPEVALRRDQSRGLPWWRKSLAMTRAMLRSFSDYPSLRLMLASDREELAGVARRTRFVAVANNPYKDEPGVIPGKISLQGGSLAAYISHHRGMLQVIRGSLSFLAGHVGSDPRLEAVACHTLRIEPRRRRHLRVMLDGEILKLAAPLTFQIRPRCLRVLVPETARDE